MFKNFSSRLFFLPFRKSGTCTTFSECMIVNRSTYIDQLIRSKGNGLITLVQE